MNQKAMNSPSPELPELLASIRSHADLMKIPEPELPRLAEEIRNKTRRTSKQLAANSVTRIVGPKRVIIQLATTASRSTRIEGPNSRINAVRLKTNK